MNTEQDHSQDPSQDHLPESSHQSVHNNNSESQYIDQDNHSYQYQEFQYNSQAPLLNELQVTLVAPAIGVHIVEESTLAKCQYCNNGQIAYGVLLRFIRSKLNLPNIFITRITCAQCIELRKNWNSQT